MMGKSGYSPPLAGSAGVFSFPVLAAGLLAAAGCTAAPDASPAADAERQAALVSMAQALTFHASFDAGIDADRGGGDLRIHTASSLRREEVRPGLQREDVTILPGQGRYGSALYFGSKQPAVVFYQAEGNVDYRTSDWSGGVSVWMSLTPDEDLEPGFSDPLMIAERSWDDGALFLDFSRDDRPRHFRMGIFSDRGVWNPGGLRWDDVPEEQRPMVVVERAPFDRQRWTHVVITFSGFNTGGDDARAGLYIDGELQGSLEDRPQSLTWDLSRTAIFLGIDYIGKMDDLAFFDRELRPEEVEVLNGLENGVRDLY